jgi:hypothetical protein
LVDKDEKSQATRPLGAMESIEKLPTVIFQLIQVYVSENQFRQFMSCSKESLQSIKYETVHYSLVINATAEEKLFHFLRNVKDKSKQISVTLMDMNAPEIKKYAEYCDGIKNLSVNEHPQKKTYAVFKKNFPFTVFNNILHLTLGGISGITKINLYLEKTTILKLVDCPYLMEVTAWNSENALQVVAIQNCTRLVFLAPLENISEFSVSSNNSRCFDFRVGKQKKLSYKGHPLSLETLRTMSTALCFLSSVEELKLQCSSFPSGFTDISWCHKIPVLELSANFCCTFPPVFYGKQLKLQYFNLSIWPGLPCFPNLERCRLDSCIGFLAFPEMPMLAHLTVTGCPHFRIIPSFPSLTSVVLTSDNILSANLPFPNLIRAEISSCCNVNDVSGLSHVVNLNISTCFRLISITSLPKVKKLEITECWNLSDLQQLSREWEIDFFLGKRVIRLFHLHALRDFSFCQNIYSLELSSLSGLRNCRGIGNIHRLTIVECNNLMSTEGLGKVTGSCILNNCPSLQFLNDLKDIPNAEIYSCSGVSDLNGLGNLESLLFNNCPIFETFLEEYRKEQKHKKIFSTIQHLYRYTPQTPQQIW